MPSAVEPKDRREVERILGYRFSNPRVLEAALTHGSRREHHPKEDIEDYERLEFLGDSVLQLVTSAELFREHPSWSEGDLTKARSKFVSQRPLASVARRLGLNKFIQAGESVRDRAGKERILSDVMEALLGAVYIDSGGIEAAAKVIRRCILSREAEPPLREARRPQPKREPVRPALPPRPVSVASRRAPPRPPPPAAVPVPVKGDFKTQLQNLLQTRHEPLPEYRVLREVGPEHEKIWIVEASAGDYARATGKGPTKKDAEQKAARQILALIRAMDRGAPRTPIGTRHGPR